MRWLSLCVSMIAVGTLTACSGGDSTSSAPTSTPAISENGRESSTLAPAASPYDALPESVRGRLDEKFTGDFDEMVKRRVIRAGVVFNRTQYFIDHGEQRGFVYESLRLFEEQVN